MYKILLVALSLLAQTLMAQEIKSNLALYGKPFMKEGEKSLTYIKTIYTGVNGHVYSIVKKETGDEMKIRCISVLGEEKWEFQLPTDMAPIRWLDVLNNSEASTSTFIFTLKSEVKKSRSVTALVINTNNGELVAKQEILKD